MKHERTTKVFAKAGLDYKIPAQQQALAVGCKFSDQFQTQKLTTTI
jgi:hypothetical protein